MATAFPLSRKPDKIQQTITGLRITDDLTIFELPIEAYDFVVYGSGSYLVRFENPEVFGTTFAVLNPGNNVLVPLVNVETKAWVYSGGVVGDLISGNNVETTPIVIPPHPHPK